MNLAVNEIYLNRDEMIDAIASRVKVVSDLGTMVNGIEGVFVLHDNDDAEVYIFEIDLDSPNMSGSAQFISALMDEMNISAVFVPMGIMRYVGTVTADSIGIGEEVREKRSIIKRGLDLLNRFVGNGKEEGNG